MNKSSFFLILTAASVALVNGFSIDPLLDEQSRVANGFEPKGKAPKCMSLLHLEFPLSDITRICGGCLIGPNKVVTSAKCVTTPDDGPATIGTFSFGVQNKGNRRKGAGIEKITLAPGFDHTKSSSPNNIAIVTLNISLPYDGALSPAFPHGDKSKDAYVGKKLFACGFGNSDDKGSKPGRLSCANLEVVASAQCLAAATTTTAGSTTASSSTDTTAASSTTASSSTAASGCGSSAADSTTSSGSTTTAADTSSSASSTTAASTAASSSDASSTAAGSTESGSSDAPPAEIICVKNSDKSNLCKGDEGSPVFATINGQQKLVGIVGSFPGVKPSAPCSGGHMVQITQLGSLLSFILSEMEE